MSDKSKTKQTPGGANDRAQSKKRTGASGRIAKAAAGASLKADAQTEAASVALRDAGTTSAVDRVRTRPATKNDQLVALLSAKAGADVAALSTALGWQLHTTRAAMTGLRKAGHTLEASRPAGRSSSVYRIVPGEAPAKGAA